MVQEKIGFVVIIIFDFFDNFDKNFDVPSNKGNRR